MPVVRLGGSQLDVQLVRELSGSILIEAHGEADIGASFESTLATITVAADKYVRVKAEWGEANADGLWKLYINSNVVWNGRNAWTNRNVQGVMEFQVNEGDTVTLKATNLHNQTKHFTGGFYGYELIAG
jgi:hypothetical protein